MRGDPSGSAGLAVTEERINRALADAVARQATKDPGTKGILKRASVVGHPECGVQKKVALPPHIPVTHGGSSGSGAQSSDNSNTDAGDVSGEGATGLAHDVDGTSDRDDLDGDVVMKGDSADENEPAHRSPSGPDFRRRIATKGRPCEIKDERTSNDEQHVPRMITGKTAPSEHTAPSPHERRWMDIVRKQ